MLTLTSSHSSSHPFYTSLTVVRGTQPFHHNDVKLAKLFLTSGENGRTINNFHVIVLNVCALNKIAQQRNNTLQVILLHCKQIMLLKQGCPWSEYPADNFNLGFVALISQRALWLLKRSFRRNDTENFLWSNNSHMFEPTHISRTFYNKFYIPLLLTLHHWWGWGEVESLSCEPAYPPP